MIFLQNDPSMNGHIGETNFWEHPMALAGVVAMVWGPNDTLRLLVPPKAEAKMLAGTKGTRQCEVNYGRFDGEYMGGRYNGSLGYEVIFDDGTHSPFGMIMNDAHNLLPMLDPGLKDHQRIRVLLWTQRGLVDGWTGTYRSVPKLPTVDFIGWEK